MLVYLVRKFRWFLALAAVASVTSGVCGVLLISQISAALATDANRSTGAAIAFAAIALGVTLASTASGMLFERLRQRANAELRRFIVDRVLHAPYQHLERLGSPRVQSTLAEHTTNVTQFLVSMPVLLTNAVVVVGCLIYLALLSSRVFVAAVVVIGLGSVGYHFAHLWAIRYLRAGSKEQDSLFDHFRSLTEGAKELRLHRRKRKVFEEEVIGQSIEAVRQQRTKGMSIFIAASSWGNFLIYAFIGMVLFALANDAPDRTQVMTGFALVFVYMVSPLQSLLLAIPNANLARVAMDRIEETIHMMGSAQAGVDMVELARLQKLELVGVRHRYYHERSDEVFQLGPIDLAFRPGEIVFLVGGNGSGKTTLAKLLVGLYVPEAGQVRIDQVLVDDSNRDGYRQVFSAVFADFHLFDRLLSARGDDLDVRGNALLDKLHLRHKVRVRGGAFTTQALSQGQRKRLALVAAYLEDRPFLVFDEWAADQDPAFKEVFYRELLPELRAAGKTVLVISHDDRYFRVADRLIRMENGQIVAIEDSQHTERKHPARVLAGRVV